MKFIYKICTFEKKVWLKNVHETRLVLNLVMICSLFLDIGSKIFKEKNNAFHFRKIFFELHFILKKPIYIYNFSHMILKFLSLNFLPKDYFMSLNPLVQKLYESLFFLTYKLTKIIYQDEVIYFLFRKTGPIFRKNIKKQNSFFLTGTFLGFHGLEDNFDKIIKMLLIGNFNLTSFYLSRLTKSFSNIFQIKSKGNILRTLIEFFKYINILNPPKGLEFLREKSIYFHEKILFQSKKKLLCFFKIEDPELNFIFLQSYTIQKNSKLNLTLNKKKLDFSFKFHGNHGKEIELNNKKFSMISYYLILSFLLKDIKFRITMKRKIVLKFYCEEIKTQNLNKKNFFLSRFFLLFPCFFKTFNRNKYSFEGKILKKTCLIFLNNFFQELFKQYLIQINKLNKFFPFSMNKIKKSLNCKSYVLF